MSDFAEKPLLLEMGAPEYDFHDIDGQYFMLDRSLSGCFLMMWSKPMNPDIMGTVTLDGKRVEGIVSRHMPVMADMWMLGIPLRGLVREYGKSYELHIEGFVDADGNEMVPKDVRIKGVNRVEPRPEDAAHERIARQAAWEGIVLLKNEGISCLSEKGRF